jgi:hypothetical protein
MLMFNPLLEMIKTYETKQHFWMVDHHFSHEIHMFPDFYDLVRVFTTCGLRSQKDASIGRTMERPSPGSAKNKQHVNIFRLILITDVL